MLEIEFKHHLIRNNFFSSVALMDEKLINSIPPHLDELIEKLFLLVSATNKTQQHSIIQEIKAISANVFAKSIFHKSNEFEKALLFEKPLDDPFNKLIEAVANTIKFTEVNFPNTTSDHQVFS